MIPGVLVVREVSAVDLHVWCFLARWTTPYLFPGTLAALVECWEPGRQ